MNYHTEFAKYNEYIRMNLPEISLAEADISSISSIFLHKLMMNTRKHPILVEYIESCLNDRSNKAIVNCPDSHGYTPLILACINSDICSTNNIVKILIKAGANINAQDKRGLTALVYACKNIKCHDMPETIVTLVNAGADANIGYYYDDYTSILYYISDYLLMLNDTIITNNQMWQAFETLLKATEKIYPEVLNNVCGNSKGLHHAPIIKILLEYGANPNGATNVLNITSFMQACSNRLVTCDSIKLMIDAGANVNALNRDQCTPLDYACRHSHLSDDEKKKIELLLDHGANINYYNRRHNSSAIIYACKYSRNIGLNDTIKLLLNRGADCNNKDINNQSGFTYHLAKSTIESAKYFIEHGAYVSKRELKSYIYWRNTYSIDYIPYHVYLYLLKELNYINNKSLTCVKAWTIMYTRTIGK